MGATMKILILGGCGFIGTNTSLEALKRKHEVIAFDSLIRPGTEDNMKVLVKKGATVFRGDIRCREDLGRMVERCGTPDGIINFAANPGIPWSISNPQYDFNVNAMGTLNVLQFASAMGKIPVVLASTNKVYSDEMNGISMEEGKTRWVWTDKTFKGISEIYPTDGRGLYPHSPYGCSKLTADTYCQEYNLTFDVPTVINRMSCIYGLYQKGVEDQGWIDWFVRALVLGDGKINIYGDGKQVRDMLWGEDVARLYVDELEHINEIKGSVFNVGGGQKKTISLIESIKFIEELSGKKATLEFHPWRQADQKIYISDITKVTHNEILNWQPEVSPFEGIERMYREYKKLR